MKKQIVALLLMPILFIGCNSNNDKKVSQDDDLQGSEISQTMSDASNSSKAEEWEAISEMSEVGNQLEVLEENVNTINSPDKIIETKEEYERELSKTIIAIEETSDKEEKEKLNAYLNEIQHNYNSKLKEYSMPANGVIQNIENLTSRLERCQSKSEFMRILDPRHSFFKNLRNIHTIVEEKDRQPEVREKAEKLHELFLKKKEQFNIEGE